MTALIISFFGGQAQERKLKRAHKKYQIHAYTEAAELYSALVDKGNSSELVYERLANSLYYTAKYPEASVWYDSLYVLKNGDMAPENLLRFSQSLKVLGEKEKSQQIYGDFLKKVKPMNNNVHTVDDYLNIIDENSERYAINKISLNSKDTDFGATIINDTVYFSSNRKRRKPARRIDTWSGGSFLDLYTSPHDEYLGEYGEPKLSKGEINSAYHDSSPTISKDGNTMYFTRTDNTPIYKESKKKEIKNLKIYKASKIDGKWTNIQSLGINNDNYSNAHPMLALGDTRLYFVSNMPGGQGQTDIYYIDLYGNDRASKPVNLGPKVNTSGRESFPFVTDQNELYFSSDGHFGLGGYDVFYVNLNSEDQQLVNVGKPINGPSDDYAFSINNYSKKGFFSSNRGFNDNIYSLVETKSIRSLLEMEIKGVVTDKDTGEPIANSAITITDQRRGKQIALNTDSKGIFSKVVNRFKSYTVVASKEEYSTQTKEVAKKQNSVYLPFQLRRKNPIVIEEGVDLAKELGIDKVYFDYNSSYLTKDAKGYLQKLIQFLEKHPEVSIEISSHADARGSDKYNDWLSTRRVHRIQGYLRRKGIQKRRLTTRAYGERLPTNKCTDGARCSEEEYRLNRRTQFIIQKQ